ncbi:hypothetical protein ATANTOWER_004333, partial [Ataeniobius toweri]|nr:hypothetical protein [Ataeniobius toweri]
MFATINIIQKGFGNSLSFEGHRRNVCLSLLQHNPCLCVDRHLPGGVKLRRARSFIAYHHWKDNDYQHNKPLYSFEDNADYVYDVMWSPVHPAMFAAVDGMGRLDLWNLNNDTEVPTASVTIEGASALNRVRWSSGGKEVAVGDSEGRVWIYDTGE